MAKKVLPVEWLSLGAAAELLGVHPSTVRSWSDQGKLPVHRTRGGHRRYLRSEVELWMASQRMEGFSELHLALQMALRNTRYHISEGRLAEEAWYNLLDEEARQQYRMSGRSMLEGLLSYLASDGATADAEADALGYEYASRGRRYGLNTVQDTHAFLFFRGVLLESMLTVYEAAAVRSPHAWGDLFRKVNDFTDRILITLLETYEAYQKVTR